MVALPTEPPQALVPLNETYRASSVLMPLVDPDQARTAIAAYEALKRAIIQPGDMQRIGDRDYLKKPYWRRVARFFGLSLELVREERLDLDGRVAYRVTYRAIAPNGQSMDGDGMFIYGEKSETNEHNIRARAHTRAKNRAISDMVGGGEVSAEEMPDEEMRPARRTAAPAPTRPAPVKTMTLQQQMQNVFRRAHDVGCEVVADFAKVFAHYTGKEWGAKGLTVTEAEITVLRNWVISREVRKERGETLPSIDEDLGEREAVEASA